MIGPPSCITVGFDGRLCLTFGMGNSVTGTAAQEIVLTSTSRTATKVNPNRIGFIVFSRCRD